MLVSKFPLFLAAASLPSACSFACASWSASIAAAIMFCASSSVILLESSTSLDAAACFSVVSSALTLSNCSLSAWNSVSILDLVAVSSLMMLSFSFRSASYSAGIPPPSVVGVVFSSMVLPTRILKGL